MAFIHLHVHSEYSMLDGANKPKELVQRAAEIGQTALALTDHDGLYGAVDMCEATADGKVKPILGAELRCVRNYSEQTRGWHITVLALNEQGYRNLCALVTSGYRPKHYYHKPRVTIDELAENHEGIALLSGCWFGYPSQLYEEMASTGRDRTGVFSEITEQLRAAYGERFLFELYTGNFGRSREIVPWLMEASQQWGIKTVATNDAHFASPDDWRKAELLRSIRLRNSRDDDNAAMPQHQYLATEQEMLGWLPADAVANTVMVADWADFSLDLAIDNSGRVVLPKVLERLPAPPIPEGMSDWDVFVEALHRGWLTRMGHVSGQPDHVLQQYYDRLRREMDAFKDTNLAGYMLIVADMAQFCAENGILKGPGRGSASGSLCSYLLGVTDIDPIAAGLFFERFLDVERASMPDIDLDFDWEERERVFGYLQHTYGADRVARICTFQALEWKAAIKDVGATMGLDFEELNNLNALIRDWDALDLSLPAEQAGDNADALRMIGQNPDLVTVVERARMICGSRESGKRVKGAIRQVGAHAAGIVIANEPLTNLAPQQPTRREGAVEIYQFDMDQTEKMGLLKIDVLSLRTLGAARDTIAMVKARRGVVVDWYSIPVDDPDSLAMARAGRTVAIFQLEKRTAQEALRQIGPTSLQDMAVVEALNRPGPLEFIPDYAHRKHHPQDATCDLAEWEPALRDTYGIMVYQEQVIQCLWALGFTFTEADEVRRAIGKKKKDQIIAPLNRMKAEIVARGYPQALADSLADKLVKFADYAFNKAHATAYACISMRMLWLKINYPEEFIAAALTSQDDDKFFLPYIEEVPRLGLVLLPPDINLAGEQFQPEEGAIRFGLSRIKHIGQKLSRAIVAVRQIKPRGFRGEQAPDGGYPYADPIDFCRRLLPHGLDRRQLECLVWAGAFDAFSPSRQFLADRVEEIIEIARKGHASMEALLEWGEFVAPSHGIEDDADAVQLKEYELLACSPSAMARDVELRGRIGEGTTPLSDLAPGQQGVTVCGRILELGVRESKKGRNYMYMQFTDGTSVQRGLCFDEELIEKLEEIGSQAGVVLKGHVSDDGDAIFIRQIVRVDSQS